MQIELGPILGFRGGNSGTWNVSALYVVKDAGSSGDSLSYSVAGKAAKKTKARLLYKRNSQSVFSYEISVPQTYKRQLVKYGFRASQQCRFWVPALSHRPNMAYASCNGFSDPREIKRVKEDKNALWKKLVSSHGKSPFHILLMGGDQVYGDSIWESVGELKKWLEYPTKKRRDFVPSNKLKKKISDFYFELYCERWNQPDVKAAFSSIPTVMMWDDHDIFDGWGSYQDEDLQSGVYQAIFNAAREHFSIFQQHTKLGNLSNTRFLGESGFSFAHQFDGIAVLALDLRSERSKNQVMGEETWAVALKWLDEFSAGDTHHLLVMSSIPVVHPDLSWAEGFIGMIPGLNELEDDLHDHWNSRGHKEERLRLIHRLLNFSRRRGIRVTLLSGDVHVAALGVIESSRDPQAPVNATVINQLTSSAIVHPAPPAIMNVLLEWLGRSTQEVDRDVSARMLKFAGTNERFISRRNWLSLGPTTSDDDRIWAEFHIEGEERPYTKVIHAVPKKHERDIVSTKTRKVAAD